MRINGINLFTGIFCLILIWKCFEVSDVGELCGFCIGLFGGLVNFHFAFERGK